MENRERNITQTKQLKALQPRSFLLLKGRIFGKYFLARG